MATKKNAADKVETSTSFLVCARENHEAAETLFGSKPHLSGVLYALYFHIVELLLKSYLRARGQSLGGKRDWHDIENLHKRCQELGLRIPGDQTELYNVVGLLNSGNVEMRFRYYPHKAGVQPDLSWTREIVGQLMQVVGPFVESKQDPAALGGAQTTVTVGKTVGKRVSFKVVKPANIP